METETQVIDEAQAVDEPTKPATPSFADSLRMLADFLDSHPDIKHPGRETLLSYYSDVEQFKSDARKIGSFDKEAGEKFFHLHKQFGCITMTFYTDREAVCHRVVVGSKKEIVKVPVSESEITYREEEKVVEIVEWRCPESLLAKQ